MAPRPCCSFWFGKYSQNSAARTASIVLNAAGQLGLRSIFQHAVVVTHPHDIFFRRAQHSFGKNAYDFSRFVLTKIDEILPWENARSCCQMKPFMENACAHQKH